MKHCAIADCSNIDAALALATMGAQVFHWFEINYGLCYALKVNGRGCTESASDLIRSVLCLMYSGLINSCGSSYYKQTSKLAASKINLAFEYLCRAMGYLVIPCLLAS